MTADPTADQIIDAPAFVARYPDAAMITLRSDGTPHTARVELGVVEQRIRTTGAPGLVRTKHLRRDPRCTLFVFGPHPWWLGLETEVDFVEGPEAPGELVRLLHSRFPEAPEGTVMAHDDALEGDRPYTEAEYAAHALEQGLFVIDFTVRRAYGNVPAGPGPR